METYYASPERSTAASIIQNHKFIKAQSDITALLESLPYFVMILDVNRQVVFINKSLVTFLNTNTSAALGKRPGELINCKYAEEMEGGCGTSKNCRFCGAVNAILESHLSENISTKECKIISSQNDNWSNFVFSVSCSNFRIKDKTFTLFTLTDISDKKRRHTLERLFFHDLMNSIGSLSGIIELLHENNLRADHKELLKVASTISQELIDEITSHRQILDAENNELVVNLKLCNSINILNQVAGRMTNHSISTNKKVNIDPSSIDINFTSDQNILKRILLNMVKNALEAITKGKEVIIKADAKRDKIIFSTTNPGYIPEDVQLQIFHRSFSTKDESRGLGTYSMKMHAERYLNGKVYFTTDKEKGTTFFCELPFD